MGWPILLRRVEAQVGYFAFFRNPESEEINLLTWLCFVVADTRDWLAHSLQAAFFNVVACEKGECL